MWEGHVNSIKKEIGRQTKHLESRIDDLAASVNESLKMKR
jgi:hypothetical protein